MCVRVCVCARARVCKYTNRPKISFFLPAMAPASFDVAVRLETYIVCAAWRVLLYIDHDSIYKPCYYI